MRVIGAGFVTADVLQVVDPHWRPRDISPSYFSGGTVCNILSYLAWFGWTAAILGEIGEDLFGDQVIRSDLSKGSVDTSMLVVRPGALTRRITHLVVTNPSESGSERGRHRFEPYCIACDNPFPSFPTSQSERLLPMADGAIDRGTVLIVDRANELTLALAQRVSMAGGVVVFEPGSIGRDADIVDELLRHVAVLKYSHDLKWGGAFFRDRISTAFLRDSLIIETRERDGVRACFHETEIRLTTTPIMQVVDSAGAGDAFTAGFLTGLGHDGLLRLAKLDLARIEDALVRGQVLGGLACRFIGAKGLMYFKEVDEVEAAIIETAESRRPPPNFVSGEPPAGQPLPHPAATECPVCRLERSRDG